MSELEPELKHKYYQATELVPIATVDGLMDSDLPTYAKYMALRSMITKNDFDNIEDEPYPPEVYKVDHAIWAEKKVLQGASVSDAVDQYVALSNQIAGQWLVIDLFLALSLNFINILSSTLFNFCNSRRILHHSFFFPKLLRFVWRLRIYVARLKGIGFVSIDVLEWLRRVSRENPFMFSEQPLPILGFALLKQKP